MSIKTASIFFLISSFLVSCALSISESPDNIPSIIPSVYVSFQPGDSPSEISTAIAPPSVNVTPQIECDFPQSPPNGTSLLADLIGDGHSEKVTFFWLPPRDMADNDNVCTSISSIVNGVEYFLEIESVSWPLFLSCTVADIDGDRAEELLFHFLLSASGGQGTTMITIVKWCPSGFFYLPVPQMGKENTDGIH